MVNILNNTSSSDVHSHIDKAYAVLDSWLPRIYVSEVREKLKDKNVSSFKINNVRLRKSVHIDILNAMVEVALEYKEKEEKLKKLIT